jgi:hypothetical protein
MGLFDAILKNKKGQEYMEVPNWEAPVFTNGKYKPGKSFRLFLSEDTILVPVGTGMNKRDAFAITLAAGYHHLTCDALLEADSGSLDNVVALFYK